MRFARIAIGLCAFAAGLFASTINVTSDTSQVLQSGDSLEFLFTDTSYAKEAASLSLPATPSQIFFCLASAPNSSIGQFTAELESGAGLESGDGSSSVDFSAPVDWSSGEVQLSSYSGAASIAESGLNLSSAQSQAIFSGSTEALILTYTGADVTIGLGQNTLKQDMGIMLASGGMTIGAMDYNVEFEAAPVSTSFDGGSEVSGFSDNNSGAAVPEPDGRALLAAGAVLCVLSGALKKIGRTRD